MTQAYIVDALRSPTGRRNGSLASVHGADLGAHVIKAIVERNAIPADEYDDVILAASTPSAPSLATSPALLGWQRACPCACLAPPLIANAAPANKPSTLLPKPS